jgi:hypothetical protein
MSLMGRAGPSSFTSASARMRARARRRNSCPCLGSSADRADDEVVRTQLERGGAPPEVGRLGGRAALGGWASRTREVGCRIDPLQDEVERRWSDLGLSPKAAHHGTYAQSWRARAATTAIFAGEDQIPQFADLLLVGQRPASSSRNSAHGSRTVAACSRRHSAEPALARRALRPPYGEGSGRSGSAVAHPEPPITESV